MTSDFALYYVPALNMGWLPGARDVQPNNSEIYGVHDFLSRFIKPDPKRQPGDNFDYNSSNADVLGWLIARLSGQPFQDFIQQNIWAKLGAEHDATIAVDRAYTPAVITAGMPTAITKKKPGLPITICGGFLTPASVSLLPWVFMGR